MHMCSAASDLGVFGGYLENATRQVVVPPASVDAVADRNIWCHERLRDRAVDAWASSIDELHSYKLSKCSENGDMIIKHNIATMPNSMSFVRVVAGAWMCC